MSYLGTYLGEYPGNWWGTVAAPVPPEVPQVFGGFRKKKPKKLSFDDEIAARQRLRTFIANLVDELDGTASVVATPSTEAIAIVSGVVAEAIAVPVELGRTETLRVILEELSALDVCVTQVRTAQAQAQARAVVDAFLEARRKRRRNEEWLLLLN